MKNNQQTPFQKLISDKLRVTQKCQEKELRLSESYIYAQENASGLFFSAFTSLLFPNSKTKESPEDKLLAAEPKSTSTLGLGLADLLPIAKSTLPVVWDIVKPLLLSYGVTKAQGWILHSIFKKK